jgi:hypothetical protein
MDNTAYIAPPHSRRVIDLNYEERTLLNTVIDLLIPADEEFPPPSSLHLIDEFLSYLRPALKNNVCLVLSTQRLRALLHDLNASAGGNFCQSSSEQQHRLLRRLESSEPALYQALWSLANYSYYTHLAIQRPSLLRPASLV